MTIDTINTPTCGCCSNGCVCHNHQDVPRGLPVQQCAVHAPYAAPAGETSLRERIDMAKRHAITYQLVIVTLPDDHGYRTESWTLRGDRVTVGSTTLTDTFPFHIIANKLGATNLSIHVR